MKKKCWSCNNVVPPDVFFCPECNSIQDDVTFDEFSIFGLEKKISIEEHLLEENYLKLQKKFHPDNFINMSEKEREISSLYSAKINEAYHKLKNNILRINLILEYSGHNVSDLNKTFKNSEMLEEIFEIQEEFMFAENEQKKFLKKKINKLIEEILIDTEKLYKSKNFEQVSKNNIKLSYLDKILNSE